MSTFISSLAVVLIHRYRTCCLIDGIHPRYFTVCSCCACCTNSITIQRKTTYPQSAVAGWAGNDIFAHLIIGNLFSSLPNILQKHEVENTLQPDLLPDQYQNHYSYRLLSLLQLPEPIQYLHSLHMKCNCYCLLFLLVCRLTCPYINAGKQ